MLVAVVLLIGLGGGSRDAPASAAPAPAPTANRDLGHVSWILAGGSLEALRQGNAGLARRFFDNAQTFVVGTASEQDMVPYGYSAIPTRSYTSLRGFEADLHFGRIAPQIGAVIYDPEAWGRTPVGEQRSPIAAMRRFTELASHWGYGPILAPGRDLALAGGTCSKQSGERLDAAYLKCGLTHAASGAEDFVVQAAPVELARERLHLLLRGARSQLHHAAPEARGFATLSAEPPEAEQQLWPIDLVRAARLELAHLPGIMLNFNSSSVDLAASFLRDLERGGPVHGMRVAASG